MKIAQFYDIDRIRLGLVLSDSLIPLIFNGDMIDFIDRCELPLTEKKGIPLEQVKLAPPVIRPSKIIAIGLNYQDHVKESHGSLLETPLIFAKFPNSLAGHGEDISWDTNITQKVDYEAELAVVIGKKVSACKKSEAMSAVFGYTCANDVSARDLQFGDGQWIRGKSLDSFCPMGPWIVTPDDITDPNDLKITCRLNDRVMQKSTTRHMIFDIPALISFISQHFTLLPGDIILTGTPHGVGAFRKPPVFMKHGDQVTIEIEGIGKLSNPCKEKI